VSVPVIMFDPELSWRLAKKGAIIIFDDYHWDKEPEDSMHHPKRGIDGFLTLHAGEYEQLSPEADYQVVLRKLTHMRIGFLLGDGDGQDVSDAFGYGINIALTLNSSYVIGAVVTIRSLVENTPGRITIYIVDCGIEPEDTDKLKHTISGYDMVTMVFVKLAEASLGREMGPSWAKLDMIEILPVERVLYLDADILVRKSLKTLWDTDLGGMCLGAIVDIGHPMGHDEIERRPYFNAGVLLVDLAKARVDIEGLKKLAAQMKDAKFRDQDILNNHFTQSWTSLNLTWNAQGLGTYARHPSGDRDNLPMESMTDPSVVHFTGPVHPSLVEVLNPYLQPPTSKPWGYIGSPGHPYESEWWAVLERTHWKGIRASETWSLIKEREMSKAVDKATHMFRNLVATI